MNTGFAHYRKLAVAAVAVMALAGCQTIGGGDTTAARAAKYDGDRERDLRLAAAARSSGQYDAALSIYSGRLRVEPDAADVQAALAETYFEQGAHAKALATYDQAVSKKGQPPPQLATALIGRGRTQLALGRAQMADIDFSQALDIQSASPIALNGRGVAADMQGQHPAAQAFYRQALALDPGNERVRSNLGLSFALAARFDDAVAELAPLASGREQAPKARHNLALALGLMGKNDQARKLTANSMNAAAAEGNGKFYEAVRNAVTDQSAAATAKPASRPAPKQTVKPVAKAAPKPVAKSEAKPAAKPVAKAEAKPAAKPVAKVEAKPAAKPVAKAEAKPAAKPVAKAEAKPVEKPVAKAEAKPVEKPVAKAEAKPVEKPVAKAEAKPAAKPVAKAEAKPVAKPVAKIEAKPAAKPVAKAEAKPADRKLLAMAPAEPRSVPGKKNGAFYAMMLAATQPDATPTSGRLSGPDAVSAQPGNVGLYASKWAATASDIASTEN